MRRRAQPRLNPDPRCWLLYVDLDGVQRLLGPDTLPVTIEGIIECLPATQRKAHQANTLAVRVNGRALRQNDLIHRGSLLTLHTIPNLTVIEGGRS